MVITHNSEPSNSVPAQFETLFAGFNHKIRNILFSMSICLDGIQPIAESSAQNPDYVLLMRKEFTRLSDLIHHFEMLLKPLTQPLVKGSLEGVIVRVLESCIPLALEKKIRIEKNIPEALPPLAMQSDRLEEAFLRILENAVYFSPQDGTIYLAVKKAEEKQQSYLSCTIQDEGPGIAEKDMEKIFEAFFSRRKGQLGLGLTLCQRIIEAHQGSVWAKNHHNPCGTVFTLRFPIF